MAPTRGAFGRRKAYRPVSRILFAPCVAPLPLIWAVGHPTALSAYPLAQTSRLQAPAYMAFHPARFTKPSELLLTLVGSYPTFSPLPPLLIRCSVGGFPLCGTSCQSLGCPSNCLPVR